jgi:hypothetical protein
MHSYFEGRPHGAIQMMTSSDPAPCASLAPGARVDDRASAVAKLAEELKNARAEIKNLLDLSAPLVPQPGQIPAIDGIDIYGESIPLHGALGGDHIIFIDFDRRYDIDERIRRALSSG